MDAGAAAEALSALLADRIVRELALRCPPDTCFLVGGTLRDALLGLPSADLDVSVASDGRALAELLAASLPARLVPLGGRDFAAYRLVTAEATLDLWDRAGTTLLADLARRDFTVDSIALPCSGGDLVDPFDGRGDLAGRVLRATTAASFREDPLRVLRLARLLAQLPDFRVEPGTQDLARATAERLSSMAPERIRFELGGLLGHPRAQHGFELLGALGVYPALWLAQAPSEAIDPLAVARDFDAFNRCRTELAALGAESDNPLLAARLALTFHGLPARAVAAAIEGWREIGYVSQREATAAAALLKLTVVPTTVLEQRRFLHAAGQQWTIALAVSGAFAARNRAQLEDWRAAARQLVRLSAEAGPELLTPTRFLRGEEVRHLLGIPAGPALGRALAALRDAQVDGLVRNREEAVAWLDIYSGSRSASTSEK